MTNRFRVSGTLARRLEELGLSPTAALRHAGLPMGLWGMGLKLGSQERIERYDPIAIAALYTRSFRDAPGRMVRYKRLTCPEEIRIVEHGQECTVEFAWLPADKAEPATLIDACFAWVVAIGRRGMGQRVSPNPDLLEMVAPQLEAELSEQLAHKSLREQVKGILKKFLAGQKPRLEDVAGRVALDAF